MKLSELLSSGCITVAVVTPVLLVEWPWYRALSVRTLLVGCPSSRRRQVKLPHAACLFKVTSDPLHSISLGHKFIFQTNCSASVGSTVFLISLLFTLLIRHHLSWPSKLWIADRRPRRVLDRGAKSDSDFDSPFWDCQSVACNVLWHFHNLQRFQAALSSI